MSCSKSDKGGVERAGAETPLLRLDNDREGDALAADIKAAAEEAAAAAFVCFALSTAASALLALITAAD